jgi:hypothetical protein
MTYLLLLWRAPSAIVHFGKNKICHGDFQALYSFAMKNKLEML